MPISLTLEDWVKYLNSINFGVEKGTIKWESELIAYIGKTLITLTREECCTLANYMCKYHDTKLNPEDTRFYGITWKLKNQNFGGQK